MAPDVCGDRMKSEKWKIRKRWAHFESGSDLGWLVSRPSFGRRTFPALFFATFAEAIAYVDERTR